MGRATLSALLHAKAVLSPEMALRIEKAFGVSMDMLMRMQAWHDTARMRAKAHEIKVQRYGSLSASSCGIADDSPSGNDCLPSLLGVCFRAVDFGQKAGPQRRVIVPHRLAKRPDEGISCDISSVRIRCLSKFGPTLP